MGKVRFGLKNVHYAIATAGEDGKLTYATPVAIPGAVSLSLDVQGDTNNFYADDIVYYATKAATSYSGSLEMAEFPKSFLTDVLGYAEDGLGQLVQFADSVPKTIALQYEVATDETPIRFTLFCVTPGIPTGDANTQTDSTNPDTQTIDVTVSSTTIAYDGEERPVVKSQMEKTTANAAKYAAYYDSIIIPAKASA